jgi:hypothetical protein
MKLHWLLTGIFIALAGCTNPAANNTPGSSTTPLPPPPPPPGSIVAPQSSAESPNDTPAKDTPAGANSQTISELGIGSATVGMTLGELKEKLGTTAEFTVQSPYIVDFDAIAVSEAGTVQYYILYPAATPLEDSDPIRFLLTDNPKYRTDTGVGPGTPIKQAEEVYGDATLSYNLANEGREYIKFEKGPAKNIAFNLGAAGDNSLAGIYPTSTNEFQETNEYRENATIRSVLVDCRGQECAKPSN